MKFQNPIIPGFYPDPSVCRVGEDYYLVNSSFEYFPGVPIFHSRDLVNWRQIGHCLTRQSQLPLDHAPPSDGIYAPTIRHHNGRFYMATTNNIAGQGFKNFFVHTEDPSGEWSEPVWVEQGGIDPSLFFDDDGKVYWTGNGTGWSAIRGIYQAEIDIKTGRPLTDIRFIWPGTGGGYPESPHLFKRGSYYYLTVAEGGTAECHMVTIARSKQPFGPFEPCPHNPILTHRSLMNTITSTGHADLFEDHQGNWWAVFLGIRYADFGFHNLGRETHLAPVAWTADGWPVIHEGKKIAVEMDVSRDLPLHPVAPAPIRDDFDAPQLALPWVHLRNLPASDWSLTARPGWLTLSCAEATLDEFGAPAFAGRRQQHFESRTAALLDFMPSAENEEAGLTALIDNAHHAELVVTLRGDRRVAFVRRRVGTMITETAPHPLPPGPVELILNTDRKADTFSIATPGQPAHALGRHELRYLSTQVAGGYTGVVLALYATSRGKPSATTAAFDWCDYAPINAPGI